MARIAFMGVMIDNVTMDEALQRIRQCIESGQKMYAVTPNVDHIVKLQHDAAFHEAYDNAGLVTVDGTPIMAVARFYGTPFKEKIPGPTLTEAIAAMSAKEGYRVFFLGAAPGVGDLAAEKMSLKYPGFTCAGTYSPPFGFERDEAEREHIIQVVNAARPDIVIAGMGSPKTEIFLMQLRDRLSASVSISTGAAIDFLAGRVQRCPQWINRIGMEWFYRFAREPRRLFKRYFIDDTRFLLLIFKYRKGRGSRSARP